MSAAGGRIDAAIEAVNEQLGGLEFETGTDIEEFLAALPQFWEGVAGAFSRVGGNMEGTALPAVVDEMNEHSAAAAGLRDDAEELYSTHRTQHEERLKRIEDPELANEEGWDISKQGN